MKLARLSLISILGSILGFGGLVIYSFFSFQSLESRQREVDDMLTLQQQINSFSAASDSLLLYKPDSDLWRAYRADSETLEAALMDLGQQYPGARKASNSIRRIRQMVARVLEGGASDPPTGAGPLAMPERSRLVMSQVAMNGVALDSALSDALFERRTRIEQVTRRIILQLALAVVLFGGGCVLAFTRIYQRVARPASVLARTIQDLQSGTDTARAPVQGSDELALLAKSFNGLMDQLQARENSLLKLRSRSDRAEAVAGLGSWEVDYASGRPSCSQGVFSIFGLDPEHVDASVSAFLERIHPDDLDRYADRRAAWSSGLTPDFDEEVRIMRPDGRVRWVRDVARMFRTPEGRPDYSTGIVEDITDRKDRERELSRLSDRLRNVLETIAEGLLVVDYDLNHEFSNATAVALLEADQVSIRHNPVQAISRALGHAAEILVRQAVADGRSASTEIDQAHSGRWLEVTVYPGRWEVSLLIRDVSASHRAAEELRRTLGLRKALINALPAHIALIDERGTIVDVNNQWRHFARDNDAPDDNFGLGSNYLTVCDTAVGECAEEAADVAAGLREVLAGERDLFAMEYPCHSPDKERWFRVMANRLGDSDGESMTGAVVMHVDITARKLAERELANLAYYDALTGLLTRHGFERELNRTLGSEWQPDAMVVLFDIVGQRAINDTFGYAAGDAVLAEIGRRLAPHVKEAPITCRLGGDEFAIFASFGNGVTADDRRRGISEVFSGKLSIDDHSISVTARCGYTILGEKPRSVDALMAEAELALFRSPEAENFYDMPWSLYNAAFDVELRKKETLARELRQSTEDGAFELHFQPKVRLSDGLLIGGEALIRWPHPRLGLQSPGVFIPLAEQSQLIGPMGEWVLHEACRQLRSWQKEGLDIVRIAVNVSIEQFLIGDIVATVKSALGANELAASALSVEITESVFEGESDALHQKLMQLHEMGVRLALDDFGTGYSSLLYLQRYPFDEIKVDRAFVSRVLSDTYCNHVVQTVVDLAAVLGAEVVAEGIESPEVAEALHRLGCGIGQGFYYSLPLESEDFQWLLERQGALPVTATPK